MHAPRLALYLSFIMFLVIKVLGLVYCIVDAGSPPWSVIGSFALCNNLFDGGVAVVLTIMFLMLKLCKIMVLRLPGLSSTRTR